MHGLGGLRRSVTAVLVTGAGGFVGSHLVQHLVPRGLVTAWTRSVPPADLANLAVWDRVDLLDAERVRAAIGQLRPSHVYHCAGAPHIGHSWRDTATPLASNVMGTHHLLDALRLAGCSSRVLITGSAAIYAPSTRALSEDDPVMPSSPYAVSKFAQELLGLRAIAEDGVEIVATRSFNHTGPRQSSTFAAPGFARQIALIERGAVDPVIHVGNLEAQRDLTDVRDIVRAYVALMENGISGVVYNVGSGAANSMRALLDGLLTRANVQVRIENDPERMRPNDVPFLMANIARLHSTTGWTPEISFERMLDDLLSYWRIRVQNE